MARRLLGLLLLCCSVPAAFAAHNIEDYGAVARDPFAFAPWEESLNNGKAIEQAIIAANFSSDREVLVPAGKTFFMIPYRTGSLWDMKGITIRIDGVLSARTNPIANWTFAADGRAQDLLSFTNCEDLTITGSGKVLGNGHLWWWHVILTHEDRRPNLLSIEGSKNVLIENVGWENSPQYHIWLKDAYNATVQNFEIWTDVNGQRKMFHKHTMLKRLAGWKPKWPPIDKADLPTFPLNTDGIDPSGKKMVFRNLTITMFDDAIAVKPCRSGGQCNHATCTEDLLVHNCTVRYGVGMTIGTVPPNPGVHCIRNVVFRDIKFEYPLKAIYIKTNPGNNGYGIIDNIVYESIQAESPVWWSLYLGPQQQRQPGNPGTGCSFFYPLPRTVCPTQPRVSISNIVFRNINMRNAYLSPGLILCDKETPCRNITMDGVRIGSVSSFPVRHGYLCNNAQVVGGGNKPSPKCSNKFKGEPPVPEWLADAQRTAFEELRDNTKLGAHQTVDRQASEVVDEAEFEHEDDEVGEWQQQHLRGGDAATQSMLTAWETMPLDSNPRAAELLKQKGGDEEWWLAEYEAQRPVRSGGQEVLAVVQ